MAIGSRHGRQIFACRRQLARDYSVAGGAASLASALNRHTAAIASQTTPVNVANRVLLQDIALVCDYQDTFDGYTNQSAAWKACWNMYRRIFDEGTANGDISDVVISDASKYGWALSDFFPQTVINWFTPENSLRVKFDAIETQMKCNIWYAEVQNNAC